MTTGSEISLDVTVNAIVSAIGRVRSDYRDRLERIDASTNLWSATDGAEDFGLDLDSLDILAVLFDVEETLGLTVPDETDPGGVETVADLALLLQSADARP